MSNSDVETIRGPFLSTLELLATIDNTGLQQKLRRYAAQRSAVFVNRQGRVVLLVRIKGPLSIDALSAIRDRECPGTAFFIAPAGHFASEAELLNRIGATVKAYSIPAPSTHMEERIVDGENVVVIGSGRPAPRKRSP